MTIRLLAAALLAALAAVAVLAFTSFGGASSRTNAYNGAPDGHRSPQPWNVKQSKFSLIAAVAADATDFIYDKGFTSVTHPAVGTYCLTPKNSKYTPFNHPAIVTPDWFYSVSGEQTLAFFVYDEDCAQNQYEVLTYDLSNTLSDNVAFQIAVM